MAISPDYIPKLKDNTGWTMTDNEVIILNPQGTYVHALNETGSRLWVLIDGEKTVKQITDILASEYDASQSDIEKDIIELLTDILDYNLIEFDKVV